MFNYTAKAPELVCVAIGVNLLFPATPVILNKFLPILKTNVDKVFSELLGDIMFLRERDIPELEEVSNEISRERKRCAENMVSWPVVDGLTAAIGILLLWTGFVDWFGGWCILLFLPAAVAIIQAWRKFKALRNANERTFSKIRERIRVRKDDAAPMVTSPNKPTEISDLALEIRRFLESRGWENDN